LDIESINYLDAREMGVEQLARVICVGSRNVYQKYIKMHLGSF